MLALLIFLTCLFVAIGTGLLAAWSDIRGLVIPNIYSVMVGGAFLMAYAALWMLGRPALFHEITSHLLAAVIMFGITALMFGLRMMGAADSKLGTVYALWVGMSGLMAFVFYTTLAGGLLALASIGIRKWKPFKTSREGGWIASVQAGQSKVPYGVAIVFGALASFVKLGYLGAGIFSYLAQS